MILDVIEWGLKAGCKSSLVEAIRSEGFLQLTKAYANLEERFPLDTDEGIALRTGHLIMGRLLNTLPEAEAIGEAKSHMLSNDGRGDFYSTIHYLGQALVGAAQQCLPQDIIDLASQWKAASAQGQIEIARQLYFEFRSEPQEARGELTVQLVYESMERKLHETDDERNILPAMYGMWDKQNCPANCQGKTQMLTAFGHLAGARVLSVNPLHHSRRELVACRDLLINEVVIDIESRNLQDADASMSESIKASRMEQRGIEESFHIGVALELKDGRWILLDPHGLVWGVFPDVWDLGNAYRTIKKYAMVLPGLQLIRHDHGRSKEILGKRLAESREFLVRSRKMEEVIRSGVKSILDLIEVVADSEELGIIIRSELAEKGCDSLGALDSNLRRCFATAIVTGGEDNMWNIGLMLSPDFLEKRIQSWLTWYHVHACNELNNQLNDEGQLLHSVCEFGLPEYHIAMAAINSLACRFGWRTSASYRFFLDYSFDQVSLHNALSDREVRQVAMQTLKALPFMHTLCRSRMDRYFY